MLPVPVVAESRTETMENSSTPLSSAVTSNEGGSGPATVPIKAGPSSQKVPPPPSGQSDDKPPPRYGFDLCQSVGDRVVRTLGFLPHQSGQKKMSTADEMSHICSSEAVY